MDILLNELVPFKRLNYFIAYFRRLHRIQHEKDAKTARHVSTLYLFLLIEVLHYLYVYLFSSGDLSPRAQFMHYALFHIISLLRVLYPLAISQFLLMLFFVYASYFRPQCEVLFIIHRVAILRRSTPWFLQSSHRGQPIWRYARRLLLLVCNLLQVFTVVAGKTRLKTVYLVFKIILFFFY